MMPQGRPPHQTQRSTRLRGYAVSLLETVSNKSKMTELSGREGQNSGKVHKILERSILFFLIEDTPLLLARSHYKKILAFL